VLSRAQKAILHVAKKKLCLDDATYRAMLEAHGGARSAKDLDYRGFKAVMKHLEAAGFKGGRPQTADRRPRRRGRASEAQIAKIKALWAALGGSYYEKGQEWRALRGFLKKRFRVEHENFLTFEQAHKVIEAIKNIRRRTDDRRRTREGASSEQQAERTKTKGQ